VFQGQFTAVANFGSSFLCLSLLLASGSAMIMVLILLCTIVAAVLMSRAMRQFAYDLRQLRHQLESFRVRDSECFCCANNHRHPETGDALLCDRLLVHARVLKWHSERQIRQSRGSRNREVAVSTVHEGAALDAFDQYVRTDVKIDVLAAHGSVQVPYSCALFTALPAFGLSCDMWLAMPDQPLECQLHLLLQALCLTFFHMPSAVKMLVLIMYHLPVLSQTWLDAIMSAAAAIFWAVFIGFGGWVLPFYVSAHRSLVPMVCVLLLYAAVTAWLYMPDLLGARRMSSSSTMPPRSLTRPRPCTYGTQANEEMEELEELEELEHSVWRAVV